jgi:ABC-type transport system involved in multi-copper enzyme maturation permease subunit
VTGFFTIDSILAGDLGALGTSLRYLALPTLTLAIIELAPIIKMARSAMLAGRATSDLIKNFILLLVVIGIGYLVGFSFKNGFVNALAMIVLVMAVSFAFSWVMAAIALSVKKLEAVQAAAFTGIFPLVFMSSALVQVGGMERWVQVIARNNPITHWANLARYFAIGEFPDMGGSVEQLMAYSAIWLVATIAVFMPSTPNPTTGFLMYVPKADVIELSMSGDVRFTHPLLARGVYTAADRPDPAGALRRPADRARP